VVEGGIPFHFKKTLDFFIPIPTRSEPEKTAAMSKRQKMRIVHQQIHSHTGSYIDAYEFEPKLIRPEVEMWHLQKGLTFSKLETWVATLVITSPVCFGFTSVWA
jgi:hypothetical protein